LGLTKFVDKILDLLRIWIWWLFGSSQKSLSGEWLPLR